MSGLEHRKINLSSSLHSQSHQSPSSSSLSSSLLSSHVFKEASYTAFIVLGAVVMVTIVYYFSNRKNPIVVDQKSEDRMTQLNEAFASAMGTNWPFILLIIGLLVAILLFFIYFSGQKEVILDVSGPHSHTIKIIFIVILCLLVVLIVLLSIKQYRNSQNLNIPNYKPDEEDKKKTNQILAIAGVSLLILFMIVGSVWYFFIRK